MESGSIYAFIELSTCTKAILYLTITTIVAYGLIRMRCSSNKNQGNCMKIAKPFSFKSKLNSRIQESIEKICSDLKSFEGLKHYEIDAITEKNTKLNAAAQMKKSSSDSKVGFSEIIKITNNKKHMTLSPRNKSAPIEEKEEFESLCTVPSLNSDDFSDLGLESCLKYTDVDTSSKRKVKRVSFNL